MKFDFAVMNYYQGPSVLLHNFEYFQENMIIAMWYKTYSGHIL